MKSENKYIGDDKFKKFLEHYSCPAPLSLVKWRFAGSICSPNMELRPTDVISSLWEDGKTPRLETKKEAELFFQFFMGLWDEMFQNVAENSLKLSPVKADDDLLKTCEMRYEEIELGFVEGFWGGLQDAKIPAFVAEVVDSLTALSEAYKTMVGKINPESDNKTIYEAILRCDKMAEKTIGFLIENYVLPRINDLKRVVN